MQLPCGKLLFAFLSLLFGSLLKYLAQQHDVLSSSTAVRLQTKTQEGNMTTHIFTSPPGRYEDIEAKHADCAEHSTTFVLNE